MTTETTLTKNQLETIEALENEKKSLERVLESKRSKGQSFVKEKQYFKKLMTIAMQLGKKDEHGNYKYQNQTRKITIEYNCSYIENVKFFKQEKIFIEIATERRDLTAFVYDEFEFKYLEKLYARAVYKQKTEALEKELEELREKNSKWSFVPEEEELGEEK